MRYLFPLLIIATIAAADDCTYKSGAHTVALVELYTSEGCSSCPPADRWISGFVNHPRIERFVPLAFHVNYWDDLGWKDRFADQRYTERQRALAKVAGAKSVYTPQVTLQGRDARNWRDEPAFAAQVEAINKKAHRANLELRPTAGADGNIRAMVTANIVPPLNPDDLVLFVVLTQDGLSSKVTAGENDGETLRHNFVVRDLAVRPEITAGGLDSRSRMGAFTFKSKPDYDVSKMRVAAFMQDVKTGEVIQAISGPVCK